ncbi:mechanosensitive ion channel family protein [Croceivirga thetidis]|uniref:Mechanosensitive ion channel n=1 Tax=Croceivirga thetidis TaxID=2721623 RepID=A0ABX1GML1_9FLAO|nr:mechanosensitive ion channel domain-containing protein [Croceivirga thetidis]NKI30310.1 mechanosensitive ion channel [Croceivirga thetidis]
MSTLNDLSNTIQESFKNLFSDVAASLPKILLGILGVIFAWIVIKIILFILKRILKAAKIDVLSQRVADAKLFGDRQLKIDLLKLVLSTVKVLLILLFTLVLAQTLGLTAISDGIYSLLSYLPTLLTALLIMVAGLYLASVVKKSVHQLLESMGVSGTKFISGSIFYLIVFFVSITALNQAGIDTEIITSNFTLILGAFLFAIALGFGLGSREVISDVLKMFYTRKKYMVGDKLKIDDLEGEVDTIDNISLTLKTKKGKIVIPISEITSKRIEILE